MHSYAVGSRFVLMLAGAAACGGGATGPEVTPTLTLTAPRQARVGERVTFSLGVRNDSRETLRAAVVPGGYAFDLLVVAQDGSVAWRRVDGPIAAPPEDLVLAPGEATSFAATWDLRRRDGTPLSPGEYTVRARLLLSGAPALAGPLEAPDVRPLTVTP